MKLCYYHDNEGNFGDDLNAWLWPKLLPGVIQGTAKHGDEYYEENNREAALLYGIGTILDQRIPPLHRRLMTSSISILSGGRKPPKSWALIHRKR